VHIHEPLVPSVSTSALRAGAHPLVGTFHAAGSTSVMYSLGRTLFGRATRRLDRRIAVSEAAREMASKYLPGDYEIVPNGVDLARFRPLAPGAATTTDSLEVLFVGRNEKRKGLQVLLDAFRHVGEDVPGCRLKLIGSGLIDEDVKGRLPSGLRDSVEVLGFVSNEELPGHYAAADVFCAPALGGESFGIVLLEAMASGTPVVASDIPGYASVVEQAGAGALFARGDAGDLAGRLIALLSDAGLREDMRSSGLEGVRQFSWENLAGRLEEVYASLTSEG
jgi:phosphatidylinositol alpha-mannosyltransferase